VVHPRALEVARRGPHFGIWPGRSSGRCSRGERPRRFRFLCVSNSAPLIPPTSHLDYSPNRFARNTPLGLSGEHRDSSQIIYSIPTPSLIVRTAASNSAVYTSSSSSRPLLRPHDHDAPGLILVLFVSCYVLVLCSLVPLSCPISLRFQLDSLIHGSYPHPL